MYSATAYEIRYATAADAAALAHLAGLDSQSPLDGRVLVGLIDGEIAAAISLDSNRAIADPFRHTAQLAAHLRVRAGGITGAKPPKLHERIRARLSAAPRSPVPPMSTWPRRTPISQMGGG